MAISLSIYPCCSLLLILQLLFLTTNAAPVDEICRQTENPSLCLNSLVRQPSIRNEPLSNLAKIAFQTAVYDGTSIKQSFQSLQESTTDPKLKSLYGDCEKLYSDTLATLKDVIDDVNGHQYDELKVKADSVVDAVDRCEAAFKINGSPLHDDSRVVRVLVEAVGVIAKTLS